MGKLNIENNQVPSLKELNKRNKELINNLEYGDIDFYNLYSKVKDSAYNFEAYLIIMTDYLKDVDTSTFSNEQKILITKLTQLYEYAVNIVNLYTSKQKKTSETCSLDTEELISEIIPVIKMQGYNSENLSDVYKDSLVHVSEGIAFMSDTQYYINSLNKELLNANQRVMIDKINSIINLFFVTTKSYLPKEETKVKTHVRSTR